MKKLATISTITAFALAPAAFAAQGPNFAELDANSDGFLSVSEILAVTPQATEEQIEGFVSAYDADNDNKLSESEFETWKADAAKAAQQNGNQ